jgi:hypothetical protein
MKYLIILLIIVCVYFIFARRQPVAPAPVVIVATPAPSPIPILDAAPIRIAVATPPPTPVPTPNPAPGAIEAAEEFYPALAQKGSAFNLMFIDLYHYTENTNPQELVSPNWPLELAGQIGSKLGINPVTIGRPKILAAEPSPTLPPLGQFDNPLDKGAYNRWPPPPPR